MFHPYDYALLLDRTRRHEEDPLHKAVKQAFIKLVETRLEEELAKSEDFTKFIDGIVQERLQKLMQEPSEISYRIVTEMTKAVHQRIDQHVTASVEDLKKSATESAKKQIDNIDLAVAVDHAVYEAIERMLGKHIEQEAKKAIKSLSADTVRDMVLKKLKENVEG